MSHNKRLREMSEQVGYIIPASDVDTICLIMLYAMEKNPVYLDMLKEMHNKRLRRLHAIPRL